MHPAESVEASTRWDPEQYERFKRERAQPFHDLLARVPAGPVRYAADLGCGTGELTRLLLDRWPSAQVWGVDSSAAMLRKARGQASSERLIFVEADLLHWLPPHPLDCIVSNAAFQWVPNHQALLERLAGFLAPGGVLAVQVPNNQDEPAYRIIGELLSEPPWKERFSPAALPSVESPAWYLARLREIGLEPDLWETIYYHQLPSPDAIVEWYKGTALRPVLSALSKSESDRFLDSLSSRVRRAYAVGGSGVVFPFRRLFFIGRRP